MSSTSDAQTLARAFLNDADIAAGDVFTDEVLLPFVQSAYRDLQRRLAEMNVTTLIFEENLTVSVGETAIGVSPAFPTGFIVPHSLRERGIGTDEKFSDMAKHGDGLPDLSPVTALRVWEWRGGLIQLLGATRDVEVKLRFEKQLADLTQSGGGSTVLIFGAEEALALRTAMLAARSRGVRAAAGDLHGEYLSEMLRMVRRNRKPEQRRGRRRRPYGYRNYQYGQKRY